MKTNKLNPQQMNSIAFSREGSGYAINWTPCGFTSYDHKGKFKAFEGWDD